MSIVSVENLKKYFNGIKAVDGITFSVKEGTIFGFLGPNGAGKTTTINILCTLLKPTSGRAIINGYDCIREPEKVRLSIGVVFQDTTLDKELTAFENLLYHAILYNVERSQRERIVKEALEFVDLYDRRDDLVKRFSGGMKRRLEVARALVHQPKILFLDEPTLGLDPQSRNNLWKFISRLPEEKKVTIFMTTHYMDEAEVCDEIAIIDRGKIIAQDNPEKLKNRIGGDVIYLKTKDNENALRIIKEKMSLNGQIRGNELFITVDHGETCLPELIRLLGERVLSVRVQRPTLNDVFLTLTGKKIREQEADSADNLREAVRSYRRRFDRA